MVKLYQHNFSLGKKEVVDLYSPPFPILSEVQYTNSLSTTFVRISSLERTVVANKSYSMRFRIAFKTPATNRSIDIQVSGSLTAQDFCGIVTSPVNTTAGQVLYIDSLNSSRKFTSVPSANSPTFLEVMLLFKCLTTGTIGIDFRSSNGGSTITVLPTSILEYTEV